jgi:hypothetical protein
MKVPEQISGNDCTDTRSAITQHVDEFIQMLDLESIVECVAKPMGPVEKWQRADDK